MKKEINVFEAFAGVGTQKMALDRLSEEYDVDFKFVGISEVNQFSILSYDAIHNEDFDIEEASEKEMQEYLKKLNIPLDDKGKRQILKGDKLKNLYKASIRSKNFGDISKIDLENLPNIDLLTYSFPCTDISGAGKQEGFLKGSNTRSSLLWECEKIIEAKRPKYLLMENVKALVSKKFKAHFEEWIKLLDNLGYKTFYEVLDAKDYGVPQHRERVFAISILDENAQYNFPSKMPLSTRLRDILEKEVDEKYYLSDAQISKINLSNFNVNRLSVQEKAYCDTLCARDFKDPKCVRIYGLYDDEKSRHQAYSIWDENGLSPTLDTMKGGGREPHIVEDKNYSICASRGRFLDENGNRSKDGEYCQRLELNTDGVSNTLTTVQKDNYVVEEEQIENASPTLTTITNPNILEDNNYDFKIIKLTPKEYWRLMLYQTLNYTNKREMQ